MLPSVTFVVPVYNAAQAIRHCLVSVLRQREISLRLIVIDHGSSDDTPALVRDFATRHPDVGLVSLARTVADRRSPARPLNEGLNRALSMPGAHFDRSWVYRLDADDFLVSDDVVATTLREGGYRELVMGTLVFFDARARSAYDYGPVRSQRSLRGLVGRGVYAVAHHATAMRLDLLQQATSRRPLYDETLETGEDLGATCRLVRALDGDESRFSFVERPYCYKALSDTSITGSLPLWRVLAAHRTLLREHPELAPFAVARGLAELALTRLVGESLARRSLQHLAGRNGEYQPVAFASVERRKRELER